MFYGPNAENIGGRFVVDNYTGIFEVNNPQLYTPMVGNSFFGMEDNSNLYNSNISLNFLIDETEVRSANSYLRLYVSDNYLDFYLKDEVNSFTSKEEFLINFSGVVKANPIYEGEEFIIHSGQVEATGDDLANDDYMSWGTWNIDATYKSPEGREYSDQLNGLWVAGDETPVAVMDEFYTNGEAYRYSGRYKAIEKGQDANNIAGNCLVDVDFGAKTAILTVQDLDQNHEIPMTLENNNLLDADESSREIANGKFYGPNAENIGGNFYIKDYYESSDSEYEYIGVFEANNPQAN
jgi:hypothetical protein